MPSAKIEQVTLKQDIISTCAFFSGLSISSKNHLSEMLIDKKFNPRQTIFIEGDEADGMYFIAAGQVDISTMLENGKKINLDRLGPNQFFGEIGLLDLNARSADATALTTVHLFKLFRSDFEKIAADFSNEEWNSIVKALCALLRKINVNLESIIFLDPIMRLTKKLLSLPRENENNVSTIRISQNELAEMINLSRESTNKLLADFERNGVIKTSYGKIVILDEDRLDGYAD